MFSSYNLCNNAKSAPALMFVTKKRDIPVFQQNPKANARGKSISWISLYNQNIKVLMFEKKENILNIQYHLQKGLTLSWNFRGLLNKDVYFRHLFICTSNRQNFLQSVLAQLCAKIKIGDFIAVIYKKKDQSHQKLRWSQRTASNFDKISLRGIEKTLTGQVLSLLPSLAKETKELSTPLILNILTESPQENIKYKQVIQRLRIEGYFPYHVNFFSDFTYHDISPSTGFNQINTNEDTIGEAVRIYRTLAFQTAALNVKLQLICSNIQLSAHKDRAWQTVDFGRIKRFYYGPSIHYEQDCISFLDETSCGQSSNVPMVILLEITLFSGKMLKAQKSFILTTDNIRLYGMTRCENSQPRSTYEFSKILRSKTQPFCSHSSFFITKYLTTS